MNTDYFELNHKIIGEGKPIIILHGFYPDIHSMTSSLEPIFEEINGFKRIYVDHPGTGGTKSSKDLTNSDDILNTITEFVNNTIPHENFLVIGESYGGYLARGLVKKMQEKIDGVALICPVITANPTQINTPKHQILSEDTNYMNSLSSKNNEIFKSTAVIQDKYTYERFQNEIIPGMRIADSEFLEKIRKNYAFSFDVDNLKQPFDKPSLIITGKQDSVVGYNDALTLLDTYTRTTTAILDSAGHNLKIEQPNLFNKLISNWLSRISNA
jgi:pimeloyl-ACP methyl ester carboxylesterase